LSPLFGGHSLLTITSSAAVEKLEKNFCHWQDFGLVAICPVKKKSVFGYPAAYNKAD